jgi:hypothetical protein
MASASSAANSDNDIVSMFTAKSSFDIFSSHVSAFFRPELISEAGR